MSEEIIILKIPKLILKFPKITLSFFKAMNRCKQNNINNYKYDKFIRICKYEKYNTAVNGKKRNTYKNDIKNDITTTKHGLYLFLSNNGKIIYIGAAHDQTLYERTTQHFAPNDSGGLRMKLEKDHPKLLEKLDNSTLYVCPFEKKDKREILLEEALLIKFFQPIINTNLKK